MQELITSVGDIELQTEYHRGNAGMAGGAAGAADRKQSKPSCVRRFSPSRLEDGFSHRNPRSSGAHRRNLGRGFGVAAAPKHRSSGRSSSEEGKKAFPCVLGGGGGGVGGPVCRSSIHLQLLPSLNAPYFSSSNLKQTIDAAVCSTQTRREDGLSGIRKTNKNK